MWPCEKTAVFRGSFDQRRNSACIVGAVNDEPVSTMNSPSSVAKAEQLPKVGRKATSSVISARAPPKMIG